MNPRRLRFVEVHGVSTCLGAVWGGLWDRVQGAEDIWGKERRSDVDVPASFWAVNSPDNRRRCIVL